MRIAFVLSSIGNYGPFIVARDIIKGIKENSEKLDVFYLKYSENALDFTADKVTKIKFSDKIDFSDYDIIHSHGFLADAYLFYHRRQITAKRISTLHQEIKPDYSMAYGGVVGSILEKVWCRFLSKFDKIVCLSKNMVEYYSNTFDNKRLAYVYNGIENGEKSPIATSENYKNILSLKGTNKILGVSARLIFRKGIDLVIKALEINKNKNLILVIIGDGEERIKLQLLAEEVGVSDRCYFVGYTSNVLPYYKLMDFYIMSSRSEAFGLCVIEAASLGIPLICSDLPIYTELFAENEVIRFVPNDPRSLSEAINSALLYEKDLGMKIYDKYLNNFTLAKMAESYQKIYRGLLEKS